MSQESDYLLTFIETASAAPQSVTGDAGSFSNHSLTEMIAAHRYISGLDPNVINNPRRGLRFTKIRPPGAV